MAITRIKSISAMIVEAAEEAHPNVGAEIDFVGTMPCDVVGEWLLSLTNAGRGRFRQGYKDGVTQWQAAAVNSPTNLLLRSR